MGYQEIFCQICGVSFNISRTPTVSEPHLATTGEAIADPRCTSKKGYPGDRISPEEVRGINAVQCLALKRPGWQPEADDQYFESESRYYLTGLGKDTPTTGRGLKVCPPRHGAAEVNADLGAYTYGLTDLTLGDIAFPFHTACFELFRQASTSALGKADIDGMMLYREHTANNCRTDLPLRHHPAVRAAQGRTWGHRKGDEWLVANPVLIPALRSIVLAALDVGVNFKVEASPFSRRPRPRGRADVFSKLPWELARNILSDLAPRDIAALRLASRTFTHFPISLWRTLLTNEMPLVYEAWSRDAEPYALVTRNAEHLHADQEVREKAAGRYERIQQTRLSTSDEEDEMVETRPVSLPHDKTNWYLLYMGIMKNRDALRVLRNRKRIWDAVGQMVERIKAARQRDGIVG